MDFAKIKNGRAYQALRDLWMKRGKKEDERLGVDFSLWEEPEQAGFDPARGNRYQPSTDGLTEVLGRLPVRETDAIIDIGCGKGRAMHLMSAFPFRRIDGIDLSEELCRTAHKNFSALGLRHCRVCCRNAAAFEQYDDYNYFYLFNSFPAAVFRKMLNHILYSIARRPRKVYFIYLNPVCHEVLTETGVFRLLFRKGHPVKWFRYHCYTNEI
ncbi:class I SAM-dependent methyltransferase [Christensenella intestinihominis]|uniref:class I SAM-dependent methyltransferase n=1 Tax=Christensenella intestinihominis TaxID=1851429 RepID=UPI00082EFDF3|nr:class I SAM-dependent methyltransferase [Christensenella intestinihominis]